MLVLRLITETPLRIICRQEDTYNEDDMNDVSIDFTPRKISGADGSMAYASNAPSLNYGASPNYHPTYDGYAGK